MASVYIAYALSTYTFIIQPDLILHANSLWATDGATDGAIAFVFEM
ncbi:MAG: hypothetical protein F6K50_42810 [Moorea sp. SIO3I7]|nr:hypothetical protein [Moorena sp. SIO3I7]